MPICILKDIKSVFGVKLSGADSCVTSLAFDPGATKPLIIAGCGDGSVRLFDKRCPPQDAR